MQVYADTHANRDMHISVWAITDGPGIARGYWSLMCSQCCPFQWGREAFTSFFGAPLAFSHTLTETSNISLDKDKLPVSLAVKNLWGRSSCLCLGALPMALGAGPSPSPSQWRLAADVFICLAAWWAGRREGNWYIL